jgi:hypothetical protein
VLGLSGCSTKGVGVAPTPLTFSLFTWGAVVANSPPRAAAPLFILALVGSPNLPTCECEGANERGIKNSNFR